MRLDEFISENTMNDYIKVIKRDCKPWLNGTKSCNGPFFRGLQTAYGDAEFVKKKVRVDRRPMNTTPDEQQKLDFGFQKQFGWKPRSGGVFVTSNITESRTYGRPYFFFAIGQFKYVWSPWVVDSYTDMPILKGELSKRMGISYSEGESMMERIPKTFYTDENICRSTKQGNEIIVNCKTYYILSTRVFEGSSADWNKQLKKLLY